MKEKGYVLILIFILLLPEFSALILQVKAENSEKSSLIELYAGGHDPGFVYHYLGNCNWEKISPELGYAVMDLAEFDGHLYAAVTTGLGGYSGVGRVYRYDGNNVELISSYDGFGSGVQVLYVRKAIYKDHQHQRKPILL